MSIIERAKVELAAINFGEEDSKVMIEILEKFFDQWDSGGAVWAVAPVLQRLIAGQPLKPLTGEDDEWSDPMGDGSMLQNRRCSTVFKEKGKIHDLGNPGWDGTFPYDPSTRFPSSPVLEINT